MTRRECGVCQLCCRLLPMPQPGFEKPANVRCKHQRHNKGCAIYARRPQACELWTCRWLGQPVETAGLPRPDHAHYVVDVIPDFITAVDNATGEQTDLTVIQVWIDPAFPDAYKAPALRAYLAREGELNHHAAICRYNERDAIMLFPPSMTASGQWEERREATVVENTPARRARQFAGASITVSAE